MPTMVQNVLNMNGILKADVYWDEEYRSNGERKLRQEVNFDNLIPTPSELSQEHSPVNEIKVLYYLTDGLCCSKEGTMDYIKKKAEHDFTERLSKCNRAETDRLINDPKGPEDVRLIKSLCSRAVIDDLYDITADYTREMNSRKAKSIYDDGEKLAKALIKYDCIDSYEWRLKNWGCIWNATSTKIIDSNTISFLTPDYPPRPVVEALAQRYLSKGDKLLHIWFPEDYSASDLVKGGESLYIKNNMGDAVDDYDSGHNGEGRVLDRANLFKIYYMYKDDVLGAHKMSAFNSDTYDHAYIRLDANLRTLFKSLCKYSNTSLTNAVRSMAQEAVNENRIPFNAGNSGSQSHQYENGEKVHTNIRMPRKLLREFDVVCRKTGTTVNRVIVDYMMECLAEGKIIIADDK